MEWQFRLNWQALVDEAKQRRKKLKLTQATLATLANISTPSVSHFENGEKDIQLSTALSILTVLGMTDQRSLLFTALDVYYQPEKQVVIFMGQDEKKPIPCGITLEALEDHFDLLAKQNPIKTFKQNQNGILYLAKKKFLQNRFEGDGSILITTKDF